MEWEALGVVTVSRITERKTPGTARTVQHWREAGTGDCAEKDS